MAGHRRGNLFEAFLVFNIPYLLLTLELPGIGLLLTLQKNCTWRIQRNSENYADK